MLDKQDTFTRWYQGIFGFVVFFISVYLIAYEIHYLLHPLSSSYRSIRYHDLLCILGFGGFYLSYRCLWYAITGEDNINRDDS